ncbi:Ig-like domain-containing protein [uncultured Eudoraea sp.]|uniref:Ig-like domain-containing protein n=1 Tax=uncultured Eudoraea sp. TaxID=1035614 RepID=UPI00261D82C9|nr:Ig-like domain-containing protein [uncultured Eudoraea sp.]
MPRIQRILSFFFLIAVVLAVIQCARRGTPTGGPKDTTPPVLIKADPENLTTEFKATKIRLYFDEYIKLEDVQNQLIVSPPLKYNPEVSPQGGASKFVEIILKDTLLENTTYTLNFGQSIVDNNEGNPNSFLTYVFSTGTYIDSLTVSGVVKDAFNLKADEFISVMLYEIDTAYTDSTIFNKPPNYLTNTLDSTTIFQLKYLKAGKYALFAIKDESKNNVFDQNIDKIGFIEDTVTLPTDTVFLLNLFKEIPNYSLKTPNFAAANKIIFGYSGGDEKIDVAALTELPDSVRTLVVKEPEKDTLNYWFTPFEIDSIIFKVTNESLKKIDTFTVKTRKLVSDSLMLIPSHRNKLNFADEFHITTSIPIVNIDTTRIAIFNKDTIEVNFETQIDTALNRISMKFEKEPDETYFLNLLPDFVTDFFGDTNDTINYRLSTGGYADFGNLRLSLAGDITYPIIVQLTDDKGELYREIYVTEATDLEFNTLEPGNYLIRIIIDKNANGKWDTGNYLRKIQPEKVIYYPTAIEMRANWEKIETFTVLD